MVKHCRLVDRIFLGTFRIFTCQLLLVHRTFCPWTVVSNHLRSLLYKEVDQMKRLKLRHCRPRGTRTFGWKRHPRYQALWYLWTAGWQGFFFRSVKWQGVAWNWPKTADFGPDFVFKSTVSFWGVNDFEPDPNSMQQCYLHLFTIIMIHPNDWQLGLMVGENRFGCHDPNHGILMYVANLRSKTVLLQWLFVSFNI